MDERELSLLNLLQQRAPKERPQGGMQLLHLEVEDVFCYHRASLELEEGITMIAGPNGSGKSSLLESIFFALYGSRAGPAMGRSLGEVLREGARTGRVRLDFLLGGRRFTVEMGLKRQGNRIISEREGCRLRDEDGAEWVGVEEATTRIQELLRMDRDDFTHCVYVRQGEIDRLIRAGEEERRGMIDRLLRLERLDDYAARAREGARRAVNRRLAKMEGQAANLEREIAALEAEDLHREKARLQREIEQLEGELARLERERARLEEARAGLRERLRRLGETEKEIEERKGELGEKGERLKGREGELERLRLLLEGLWAKEGEQRARFKDILGELELPQEELLASLKQAPAPEELPLLSQALTESRGRLEELKSEAQRRREGLARLEAELGHLGKLAENLDAQGYELRGELAREQARLASEQREIEGLRSKAEGLNSQFETLKAQIEGCDLKTGDLEACQRAFAARLARLRRRKEELGEELVAARTERERAAEQLAEMEELIRAGRCPTCGQPVTAATVATATAKLEGELRDLDRTIQRLEEDLEGAGAKLTAAEEEGKTLERLALFSIELRAQGRQLEGREKQSAQLEGRLKELEERLRGAEDSLKENEAMLAAKEGEQRELSEELANLTEELEQVEEHQARLEEAQKLSAELLETRAKLEEGEARKGELLRVIGELREDLARLEGRLRQLTAELGDRAELKREEARLQEQIAKLRKERMRLQGEQGELLNRRGAVVSKLERLESLEEEHRVAVAELKELQELGGEVEQLGELYRSVKGELRKRNIAAINHYFNNLFRLMDAGESYSRALVGEGYEIEVELKDGRRIDPAIMSGGERALINIALRCAIHQVLAQAVRAMPLILDEPTVYLDRDRINRLQFLLEELGSRIGQVIVVSHEEGLVEGADHEYRTEKGRDNVSTVRKIR